MPPDYAGPISLASPVFAWDGEPARSASVAETLLAHLQRCSVDLLIMAAFGHARRREWVQGGTTRDILLRGGLPTRLAC